MAGWSMLTTGSCTDIIHGCKSSACCSDVNHGLKDGNVVGGDDDSESKLRCLFIQVLSVFSNEVAARGYIRPFPALLGNGESLDLFKLFLLVRKRGGFDLVNGFWNFVVRELGLDLEASGSVKLVYFKYLYELERWLRRNCKNRKLGNGQCQSDRDFGCLSMELEIEFKRLLSHGYPKRKDHKYKKNDKNVNMNVAKCKKVEVLDTKDENRASNGVGNRPIDDDEKCHDYKEKCSNDDADVVIMDPTIGKEIFNSKKRKRQSVARMLNWVIQVAKCPDDPLVGELPPLSKWKDKKGGELWAQVIRARDALLRRKHITSDSEQSLLQNNQKMHPSIYEDITPFGDQFAERLRCSDRLPALVKPRSCSCCNPCSSPQGKLVSPPKAEPENGLNEQPPVADDVSTANTTLNPSAEEHIVRHALVGPRFQAEVPQWTGIVSESETKWLGTKLWLLANDKDYSLVEMDCIGRGRPDFCGCQLPGSVECVRFHIAEKRMKLKLELGPAFYHWRFDRMGEEISLRWTAAEEERFKDMVRFNPPSLDKCFWDDSCKYFPKKKREELVSYYFNVFLVQRRSYQNRVTPKHIDSDDDESEFGSLSYSYGHKAVHAPGTGILICSENKQCTDL